MSSPGQLLAGRYELGEVLAAGGMGQVWRGRDTLLGRPVAVKVLLPGLAGDPSFLARFRAEAQHAAGLNHPNIAAVHDYGEQSAPGGAVVAFLVMELVEGQSLAALLAQRGRLDVPGTLSIVGQTAAALAAAHAAAVVHRDVKPGNVLLRPDGLVKITDFGIARSAGSAPLTGTGQLIGTAAYLSPEQAAGEPATAASDVYALGVVAYECLAGRRPFDGDVPVQVLLQHLRTEPPPLPPDVPPAVRELVAHAMVKDPAGRIPDAAAFAAAADRVAAALAPSPGGRPAGATAIGATAAGVTGLGGDDVATAVLPAGEHRPAGQPTAVLPPGPRDVAGTPARPPLPAAAPRRRTALLVAAVALVALVLVAAVLAGSRSGSTSNSPAPSTAATSSPAAPTRVSVDAAMLIGQAADQAAARLRALGLVPVLTPTPTTATPAGQVTAVTPTGLLSPGQQVTLTYATTPGHGHGKDQGDNGDGGD